MFHLSSSLRTLVRLYMFNNRVMTFLSHITGSLIFLLIIKLKFEKKRDYNTPQGFSRFFCQGFSPYISLKQQQHFFNVFSFLVQWHHTDTLFTRVFRSLFLWNFAFTMNNPHLEAFRWLCSALLRNALSVLRVHLSYAKLAL